MFIMFVRVDDCLTVVSGFNLKGKQQLFYQSAENTLTCLHIIYFMILLVKSDDQCCSHSSGRCGVGDAGRGLP